MGSIISGTLLVAFLAVGLLGAALWGCPQYSVYQQRLAGEAELANAQYSKQVAVQAKLNSADLIAKEMFPDLTDGAADEAERDGQGFIFLNEIGGFQNHISAQLATGSNNAGAPKTGGRNSNANSEQGYGITREPLPEGFFWIWLLAGLLGGLISWRLLS